MTSLRVGRGRWAGTVDVIYMGLSATKNSVTAEMDQWCVEPTLSYRVHPAVEVLAGVRYNSLEGKILGPIGNDPSQAVDWIDPIVGAHLAIPIGGRSCLAHFRGDVGGFGLGSGSDEFVYNVLTQGPQLGLTFHF